MSIPVLEAPAEKSSLSNEQKAWLKKLGDLVSSGGGGNGKAGSSKAVAGVGNAGKEAIAPALVIPEVVPVVVDALKITCNINLHNQTKQTLTLVSFQHDNGLCAFEKAPPSKIGPGDASFVVVNKFPFTKGVLGQVEYQIDDQTRWFVRWEHSRDQVINPFSGGTNAIAEFRDNNDQKIDSKVFKTLGIPEKGDNLEYTLSGGGANPTPPNPNPPNPDPPTPNATASSCLITIKNNTQLDLSIAEDPGKRSGDYRTFPADTIPAGGSSQFVFEQTPNSKDQDCEGFVSYEVGSPSQAIWRLDWHNPKNDKNTATGKVDPQTAGFKSISEVGEGDENVPIVFTISGGPKGGDNPPGPKPPDPDPPHDDNFDPPPGSRQPTLRNGDKSADGWVEYLQRMLNRNLGENTLKVDGNFGAGTEKAVRAFQTKMKLQVDGTVGNQTWAALRGDKPEGPSSDGRAPHTFEQKDAQARWEQEPGDAIYDPGKDELHIFAVNVGEQKIDDFNAHVQVTPPGGKAKAIQVKIGPPLNRTADDQGDQHIVVIPKFRKTFPALDKNGKPDSKADIGGYLVEAYFDKELGPDVFKGNPIIR